MTWSWITNKDNLIFNQIRFSNDAWVSSPNIKIFQSWIDLETISREQGSFDPSHVLEKIFCFDPNCFSWQTADTVSAIVLNSYCSEINRAKDWISFNFSSCHLNTSSLVIVLSDLCIWFLRKYDDEFSIVCQVIFNIKFKHKVCFSVNSESKSCWTNKSCHINIINCS